ncbi:unnamed protein product [Didymodactylos carnosus]|uniref:Uncharacterized protein n=1 Tax=Didymodactylos carnosus TaxID=1234261 RepID=A0A813SVD4_9BILA|nr:unnamed protein product [Didymodactylos carnosus]CAF0805200.1 unnamed protein product [Didymodactylos carnosus]CAF3532205.1 unnamed protein product [Didymodactylos carnosus]CAF3590542.1 unnamed protein product [Didymodactylos carnosus]
MYGLYNTIKQKLNNYKQFPYQTNSKYKTKFELIRLSAVVCGIEFCYAAETAFVSPILLTIGMPVIFMTFSWCLSPLIGFFLVPALGSLSDKCKTCMGRRRPFILLYSIGILTGLLLVSNGKIIGKFLGDNYTNSYFANVTHNQTNNTLEKIVYSNQQLSDHKYGATLTVLGVLLLDLDCDACQSPSRAYLLDVTDPDQHSAGLTMFTVMAGIGGSLGYFMGGIPWEKTFLTSFLGDHVHILFTTVWIIYIVCMFVTLTASPEPDDIVPCLPLSNSRQFLVSYTSSTCLSNDDLMSSETYDNYYRRLKRQNSFKTNDDVISTISTGRIKVSYTDYLCSIIYMPSSLRWLCLTNFFCWMALVSYSLYFTDFVGQAVFGIKRVYIASQLIYSVGMLLMGILRHRIAVILLSGVAGVLYSTLFTIPYLLISKYHNSDVFEKLNKHSNTQVRGIGTDVAIVSSMVFLAQLFLSSTMGTLIHLAGSTVIVTVVAALLSTCGALSATRVLYL